MGKMFKTVTQTWNPFTGCNFNCRYCWACDMATGRLKNTERYKDGFLPAEHPEELKKKFKPGDFVFITDMGDISFASHQALLRILNVVVNHPETRFLFQTKKPSMFLNGYMWPPNCYHGTTIETNRDTSEYSLAPEPARRFFDISLDRHPHKFISIEPVMDFDLPILGGWILDIGPEIVEIGADNYRNGLPEPDWDKVRELIANLESQGIKVVEKDGLRRLEKLQKVT